MRQSNIAYPNLRAELGRQNIGICQLAQLADVNRDTLARQLSRKTRLTLDMAFAVQQVISPNTDLKTLYAVDPQ